MIDNANVFKLSASSILVHSSMGELLVQYLSHGRTEGLVITGRKNFANPVPVRVQSSCVFSGSLFAVDCDCALQLKRSLEIAISEGGLVVYLQEEGRGAGLALKFEAIRLQQILGLNTAEAYKRLGLSPDLRNYKTAAMAIKQILVKNQEIEILTNNPMKEEGLKREGINVVCRRPIICCNNDMIKNYLTEKAKVLGHVIQNE